MGIESYRTLKRKGLLLKVKYLENPNQKTYDEIIEINKRLNFKDMFLLNIR